jgi:membrane-associated phospholipid phosphatase
MLMDTKKIIDYIGVYAPIVLFIITIFILRHMSNYLFYFVFGFILNNIINIVLKLAIKEPRPLDDNKAIEVGIHNGQRVAFDVFGMPSGHAQTCGFILMFITMVFNNPYITTLYLLITTNSLVQRYLYNNHTLLQLIIGFIIGCTFGYATFMVASNKITGFINMKKDDNGPT